jgi:hypothetical protein
MEQPSDHLTTLPLREFGFQAARHIDPSSQRSVTHSTVHEAFSIANKILTDDVTPIMLLPKNSSELVKKVRQRLEARENIDVTVSLPAWVVSELPNNMSGILLGQIGLIDSLQVEQIPRAFLEADGQAAGEDIWGTW